VELYICLSSTSLSDQRLRELLPIVRLIGYSIHIAADVCCTP